MHGSLTSDQKTRQIEKLVASSVLHGSDALCHLLRFLAQHSLEGETGSVKECQIASEVFGRQREFDPRLDSTVRVQAGRLRAKLTEYYAGAGADDPVLVALPKGSYRLTFEARTLPGVDEHRAAAAATGRLRKWWWVPAGALVLAAILVIAGGLRPARARALGSLQIFWNNFLDSPDPPLVVFSNAEFVGHPQTGMRYFSPGSDSPSEVVDQYTGIGEVMAVHDLGQLFSRFGHTVRAKRARLLTWDEARAANVIFVGSSAENLPVRQLASAPNFVFRTVDVPPRHDDLAIVNLHPAPGEQPFYLASPTPTPTEDYGLIGLMVNPMERRWILHLAGITTLGTQAAAEFVCEPSQVQALLAKLHVQRPEQMAPFEAVIRVRINGGVPVEMSVAALRGPRPK